jgi:uncharacterized protein
VKIGILSDTHSYLDERILHHLADCEIILHAGDIGQITVADQLAEIGLLKAVYGNIDDTKVRIAYPEFEVIETAGVKVLIIHIAGAIGRYNTKTRELIKAHKPDVLVCGHSHILKVARDSAFNLLHVNPGAAGKHGFHRMRTLLKVEAVGGEWKNLQVVELGLRSAQSID